MPENTQQPMANEDAAEVKMFTQEQVNRIVQERIARVKSEAPADYEALKEKAAKYDEAQEAAKTDLQKATERAESLEKELEQLKGSVARSKEVAAKASEYGVDSDVLGRMSGDIDANAQLLAQMMKSQRRYPQINDQGEHAPQPLTKDDIMSIQNKEERIKAIAANSALFKKPKE